MGLTLTPRQVLFSLLGLTVLAVGLTIYMVATATHAMEPMHYAPAAILVLVTIAWPFANGWRPFTKPENQLRACGSCGTQWRPSQEGGTRFCPVCGTTPHADVVQA
ncbi:MAG: hypothetical protein AABX89_06645 [Candidatus Thermoplasmatota archaeon]